MRSEGYGTLFVCPSITVVLFSMAQNNILVLSMRIKIAGLTNISWGVEPQFKHVLVSPCACTQPRGL